MDKNMISIDNLVRQRLAGGEEERPAAGWMQMRNLLDEKMPTSAPGTNWRRVFGIGAALLLLSGLTVGGYEMLSANRGTGNGANNNTMAVNTTATGNAVSSNTTRNNNSSSNTVSNNNSSNNSNNNSAATGIAAGNNNNNASDNSSNNNSNSNTNSNATAATSGAAVGHNHTSAKQAEANKPSGNDNNGNAVAHNATKPQNTNTPVQSGTRNAANTNNSSAASQVPNNATAHANGNSSNVFNGSSANNNTQPAQPVAANKPAQPQASNNTIGRKDSMTVVQVHEKVVKQTPPVYPAKFEHDTVGIDKAYTVSNQQVAVNNNTGNNTPAQNKTAQKGNSNNGGTQKTAANNSNNKLLAANTPAKANTPSTPVPQSAAPATPSKDASLAANAKKKRNGWSMESLDQMLQDVKYNIGRVEFYPGLIGGINSTFFPGNAMGGFHIGVTGDFVINKQWSLFAELKYFNRFNNGDVIRDHYTTYTPSANGYTKDSIVNFFNFSTLQSLELPITVRYNIRKFTLFAGGNLSYNFAVNASTLTNPSTSTVAEPGNSTNPSLALSDFGARLGLGYLFGAAYKVAPGMTVDLRMTNNFWDNAKGNGAHIISNQLYRSPSVQLSFGYRLGADEKPIH
jgi:hypothetical protein